MLCIRAHCHSDVPVSYMLQSGESEHHSDIETHSSNRETLTGDENFYRCHTVELEMRPKDQVMHNA